MTHAASPAAGEPGRRRAVAAAAVALAVAATVALALYARSFLPFVSDDALISLRYADRLLAGDGLTWTDGERTEGYSNLLWVLGVAAVGPLVRGDLVVAARVLGLVSMAAALGALLHAYWPRRPRELVAPAAGMFALAACAPVAVWAIGGLEQPLCAGLLAWSLALALPLAEAGAPVPARRVLRAGLPLGLLCLARPDGALFALALGLGLLIARPRSWAAVRLVLTLAIVPAALVAGQLAFRLAYYGEWVPNTAHAKVSLSMHHLRAGLRYVSDGARAIPALPVAALLAIGLACVRATRARAVVLLVPLLLWPAYVATVGGDIFPAYRHLVPLVVVAVFVVAEAASWLSRFGGRLPAGAAALALVPVALWAGHDDPEVERARLERWEWHGKVVGKLLRRAFASSRPLLAADAAGCLPFFSGLPSLDLLGLNDSYLAKHPPPGFGDGWIGHELGDGAYVLRRQPDLLLFCTPLGSAQGCFRSGKELVASPEFQRDYTPVRFETPPPHVFAGTMWVRRRGRAGLRERPDRIEVPGLLFAANQTALVRAGPDGALEARVTPAEPVRLDALRVPAGRWRVEARVTGPARLTGPARVRIGPAGGPALAEGAPPLELELGAPAELAIEVRAEQEAGLAALTLQLR